MYSICGMNRGIAAHLDSFILPITVIIISLNLQLFYSKSSLTILLLITSFFSLHLPNHIHFTLCVCVCWHLSDLCEDQFRVGKVNRTGTGKYSHARNLLCLFKKKKRLTQCTFDIVQYLQQLIQQRSYMRLKTSVCCLEFLFMIKKKLIN